MTLNAGDLRNAARRGNAGTANGSLGGSGGGPGPTVGSMSNVEGFFITLCIGVVCAGIYWWRYVVVPLGALIVWTIAVYVIYESTLDVGQKWIGVILGTVLVVLTSFYFWTRYWPGPNSASSQSAAYSVATWKCTKEVNVREGDGVGGPGTGARSPRKFKQTCQGEVFVLKGSESFVTQLDGIQKKWVRVKTQYGEGWVNGDLVNY